MYTVCQIVSNLLVESAVFAVEYGKDVVSEKIC